METFEKIATVNLKIYPVHETWSKAARMSCMRGACVQGIKTSVD